MSLDQLTDEEKCDKGTVLVSRKVRRGDDVRSTEFEHMTLGAVFHKPDRSCFKNGRCGELEEMDYAGCGNSIRDYGRCGVYEFGE
ncbi:hypothetical protein METH109765_07570 [Mesobacillus thioparans]